MSERTYRIAFFALILFAMGARFFMSIYIQSHFHGLYTLSADDIARCRIAMLWAEHPSFFPDATWPPLPFWLGGILVWLGAGIHCMGALSILSSITTIPLIAYLSNEWLKQVQCDSVTRLYAIATPLLLFCLTPHWLKLGTSMLAEPLYVFLLLLSLCCFWNAITKQQIRYGYLSLFTALCASMTRFEGVAIVFVIMVLMIVQFQKETLWKYLILIFVGAFCLLFFPTVWFVDKLSETTGVLNYFERLRGGFTTSQGDGLFHAPLFLIKLYFTHYPSYLCLMLVGTICLYWKRNSLNQQRPFVFYIVLISFYFLFQLFASLLGMMPSHTFWRLTAPVYIALLPLVCITVSRLRFGGALVLFCLMVWMVSFGVPVIHKQQVYLTEDLYQIGNTLANERAEHADRIDDALPTTFVEVSGWDWLGIALIGHGASLDYLVYDKNPQLPFASNGITESENPLEKFREIVEDNHVGIAIVWSESSNEYFTQEGWRLVKTQGKYHLYKRIDES